jgi:hypothetical protein
VRLVVERERRADDRAIRGKPTAPESIAEDHGLRSVPFDFVSGEQPSELRLDAEDLKEVVGHRHAAETFGFTRSAEQVVADAIECEVPRDRGKGLRAFAQVEHVPDLRRLPRQAARVVVRNPDELFRPGEWQRTKEQRADDAEHRGACTDAQSGNQDDEAREGGIPPQRAKGVAQISDEGVKAHMRVA